MSLRTTTLLVIGATLAGLLGLLYLAGRLILLNSFAELENQQVEQNLQRAIDALETEAISLNTTTADYANWDDTYAFAADGNQAYVDSNFTPETLSNLGLNVVVVANPAGEVVYATGFDTERAIRQPWPPDLAAYLTPGALLVTFADEADSHYGLVDLAAGPLLVAARPILTSNFTGPIGGTLVFGRYLDAANMAQLGGITNLSLRLLPVPSPADQVNRTPLAPTGWQVEPLGQNIIAGYAPLSDLNGVPFLSLGVELPRSVYQQGRSTVRFLMLALALSGLVFGAVIWLLLERFVLSRLAGLSLRVAEITAKTDPSLRVPVTGRDELTALAAGINGMLERLAESRQALRGSENQFRTLAETSAAAIFITQAGETHYANARAEEITGFTKNELRAISLQALFSTEHGVNGSAFDLDRPDAEGSARRREVEIFTRTGDPRWLELTSGPINFEGRPATLLTAYDITERKRAEQSEKETNVKLNQLVGELEQRTQESLLLSELSDMLQTSPSGADSYNTIEQYLPILFPHLDTALYIYRSSRDVLELAASRSGSASPPRRTFTPDDCLSIRLSRTHVHDPAQPGPVCAHLPRDLQSAYVCVPLQAHGEALGILHLRPDPTSMRPTPGVAEIKRVGEIVAERLALALANVRLREALRNQAIRDPLTGLFNRRYMQETLDREVSRALRAGHPLSVIFLDLDHFKQFNDTHGHDAGDALLRELGNLLRRKLRAEDIVCRYGGEEIVIILPDASLESARDRAEALRLEMHDIVLRHYGQTLGEITASMGIAALPDHATSGEQLVRLADQALYQAKQAGRDQIVVASA